MAFQAKSYHYFSFHSVAGLATIDFTVDVFTIDGVAVDIPTSDSLEIVEVESGYYYGKYLPSKAGFYFIGLSNVANSLYVTDAEDIEAADFAVNLTQDTGGTNALRPQPVSLAKKAPGLDEYLLMVFSSDDWDVGRTTNTYAIATTRLDVHGNWLSAPLVVSPGTYHIIIRNNFGLTRVIKPSLEVGGDL